jgi:hypothetical protein
MAAGEKHRRGEMALLVLHSLPARHEMYFYREMRRRCMDHMISLGVPLADRSSTAGELLSEVMAKLLGVGSSSGAEDDPQQANHVSRSVPSDEQWPSAPSFQTNSDAPEQDERVRWLIQEVGGRRALKHRFEDMRRRRWGRAHGLGYRMVQISALSNAGPETGRDEDILAQQEMRDGRLQADHEDPHHDRDVRRAWAGMLAAASSRFKPHEDARKLLDLLARDPDVQADFGAEWPVRKIADALNIIDPDPPWNDDRIENAKKRLRNWIGGMKRDHGLDQTDLMALFARYGRAAASGAGSTAPPASELGTGTPSAKGAAHD